MKLMAHHFCNAAESGSPETTPLSLVTLTVPCLSWPCGPGVSSASWLPEAHTAECTLDDVRDDCRRALKLSGLASIRMPVQPQPVWPHVAHTYSRDEAMHRNYTETRWAHAACTLVRRSIFAAISQRSSIRVLEMNSPSHAPISTNVPGRPPVNLSRVGSCAHACRQRVHSEVE